MDKKVIHIYGASGSGTSTLGKYISEIRMDRLKEREKRYFGSRIEAGGDMYQNHLEFMEWEAGYNTGGLNTRSLK